MKMKERRMTQYINKSTKAGGSLWNFGLHSGGFSNLYRPLGSYFFALFFCSMVFVGMVAAHSDVDPEIAEITQELASQPDNVALLLRRGQLYRFNAKFNESLRDLEQAWLLDRDNRQVALERCRTLVALGRDHVAEVALDQYLHGESGVSRVVALVERAPLYARTGRPDLALADYSAALHLYPTVELYLARGHLQEGLGRLDAAAAGYLEGLSQLQQASILRRELIRVKAAQGHYSEALPLIDAELAAASVKTEWYLRRAAMLSALGQTVAAGQARTYALEEANRALAKRPTALHRVARAKVYQALGQLEAAKQDLRLAVQAAPRFTEAQDLLKKLEAQ
jgi:tetratricopeptide (TPR) repeat protein